MKVQLSQTPFDADFLRRFAALSEKAFGNAASESWISGLDWRLSRMPDVTVFTVQAGGVMAGYKAGYATAYNRYYSWLGAVHPDFQRQSIGRKLMRAQHEWLSASRFLHLETQVAESNQAMKNLNIAAGFKVSGTFLKRGEPYLIMEKGI